MENSPYKPEPSSPYHHISLNRPPPAFPPKSSKRSVRRYNPQWEASFPWVKRGEKEGREVPYCKICNITLSTHRSCLSKHGNSAKHCELEAQSLVRNGGFDGSHNGHSFGNGDSPSMGVVATYQRPDVSCAEVKML